MGGLGAWRGGWSLGGCPAWACGLMCAAYVLISVCAGGVLGVRAARCLRLRLRLGLSRLPVAAVRKWLSEQQQSVEARNARMERTGRGRLT
jgi:hypothetical protein